MIIETQRLLLREMDLDDFQALFQVLGDPETMWHYPYTFDGQHVRDWIERNMNREYPDETNGKTHVSVITREGWLNELTKNIISWAEDKLMAEDMDGYRTGDTPERK